MDLYQIFTEHNRPWSGFEITCYFSILVVLLLVYIHLYKHGKVKIAQIEWEQKGSDPLTKFFQ